MDDFKHSGDAAPPSFGALPTIYPTSEALEDVVERFWDLGEGFDQVRIDISPPEQPLAVLERLGPSPFARGEFPLIGFLATTYDKVSRYALDRG